MLFLKIAKVIEGLGNLGEGSRDKQKTISISEAAALWKTLGNRYDALGQTNALVMLSKDADLESILRQGIKVLNHEIKEVEGIMKEYMIPMPTKPPEQANIISDVNAITDRGIYRQIFGGIKMAVHMYTANLTSSMSSIIREPFRQFLNAEIDLFDKFIEYGKVKSYLHEEPSFRP